MFIVEIMLAVFIGTITFSICWAANNKPLGFMAKMITVFICVLVMVQTVGPYVKSAKSAADKVERKMDKIEQKIDRVDRAIKRVPSMPKVTPEQDGNWFQKFLYDHVLTEEEKRGN